MADCLLNPLQGSTDQLQLAAPEVGGIWPSLGSDLYYYCYNLTSCTGHHSRRVWCSSQCNHVHNSHSIHHSEQAIWHWAAHWGQGLEWPWHQISLLCILIGESRRWNGLVTIHHPISPPCLWSEPQLFKPSSFPQVALETQQWLHTSWTPDEDSSDWKLICAYPWTHRCTPDTEGHMSSRESIRLMERPGVSLFSSWRE